MDNTYYAIEIYYCGVLKILAYKDSLLDVSRFLVKAEKENPSSVCFSGDNHGGNHRVDIHIRFQNQSVLISRQYFENQACKKILHSEYTGNKVLRVPTIKLYDDRK